MQLWTPSIGTNPMLPDLWLVICCATCLCCPTGLYLACATIYASWPASIPVALLMLSNNTYLACQWCQEACMHAYHPHLSIMQCSISSLSTQCGGISTKKTSACICIRGHCAKILSASHKHTMTNWRFCNSFLNSCLVQMTSALKYVFTMVYVINMHVRFFKL